MNEHVDEEVLGRAYDHRLMRRLLGYVRPCRGQVIFAAVVVALDVLAQLAGPWLTMKAIDHGIREHDLAYLDHVALLYLAVLLASFGFSYVHNQVMQRVGQRVMLDLRLSLFRHLQRLPLAFFDRNPVGRLMTRVTNDVDMVNEFVTAGDTIFGDVFALILIVFFMARLNVELMLVTFSVLPLMLLFTLVFRARVRASFRDVRTRLAHLNSFLNENLTGMGTVQMLNREARNYGQFRHVNAGHRDANLQTVFYHSVFFPLLELVGALAVSLIIWYGGRQVMWGGITLGILVAFIQYMQRFFRPISDLSEKYNSLQQAMASSERIFDLLDTAVDPDAVQGAASSATDGFGSQAIAPATNGAATANGPGAGRRPHAAPSLHHRPGCRVEFDRVWFAYDDRHWVLEDASFVVEPGEKIAVVGATGSGKTTLVSLLLRFYRPQRGEIRVDGRPLDQWDAGELRRRIGLVLQDPFLFSGTIAGNLRYGNPALPLEVIERAAREVHAHRFIERLPGGYDAEVRERGATLSAGQRQLLAFARTLVLDPAILILDEATSSVDTHTEKLIQGALRRLMQGRTSLVIAHRLSTIQDVDRIVVLHRGRVREIGTHAELLALGGIYSRLYQLQYLGAQTHSAPRIRELTPESMRRDEVPSRSVVDTGLNTP